MSVVFGPKLNLLFNANIGEFYADQFRPFLQALDQLIMGSVINANTFVPPTSPNPGDAYLLNSGVIPSGLWTGQGGKIAVWDTQVTNSGTNVQNPAWVFYDPNPGWIVWSVADGALLVFSGTVWTAIGSGGGANFPVNTDITAMEAIPNTVIDTTGYNYIGSTATQNSQVGANGYVFGTGFYGSSNPTLVQITNQAWASSPYTGPGVGIQTPTAATVVGAGFIGTSGSIQTEGLQVINEADIGYIRLGGIGGDPTAKLQSFVSGAPIQIGALGNPTGPTMIILPGQVTKSSGKGTLSFGPGYYTQTTVGAAGGASALPATPLGYIQVHIADLNADVVLPFYPTS